VYGSGGDGMNGVGDVREADDGGVGGGGEEGGGAGEDGNGEDDDGGEDDGGGEYGGGEYGGGGGRGGAGSSQPFPRNSGSPIAKPSSHWMMAERLRLDWDESGVLMNGPRVSSRTL